MSMRFEGKNLDEALDAAASALGVERYRIKHHVVTEKRGFFGGIKRLVIEAEINENATPPPVNQVAPLFDVPRDTRPRRKMRDDDELEEPDLADDDGPILESVELAPVSGGAAPRRPRPEDRSRGPERGGERAPRGRARGGSGRKSSRGAAASAPATTSRRQTPAARKGRGSDDLQPGDFEFFAQELPEQGSESADAKVIRTWCEKVIGLAKFDLQIRTSETESELRVAFYGSDSKRLVDRDGELLDALQVLANKALVGRGVEKAVEFDAAGFKQKRVDDLEQQARKLADRVRRERREQLLPAMSPIERRIVHIALRDDAYVTTESRGEGFFKRVALILRPAESESAQTEPESPDQP
jgi:spoIIIJ-associated protein